MVGNGLTYGTVLRDEADGNLYMVVWVEMDDGPLNAWSMSLTYDWPSGRKIGWIPVEMIGSHGGFTVLAECKIGA